MEKIKESECDLQNLENSIKIKTKRFNIKYLLIPIIYVFVIFVSIPNMEVYSNEFKYEFLDSYRSIKLDKTDKVDIILERYKLTRDEFNVLCAIVLSESESKSYNDAYAVINTIYNRTHAKNWVRSVSNNFGKGKGTSLYYQAIQPGQFTVYKSGAYKRHLNETNSVGYNAIVDFLFSEDVMHDYLSFRSHSIKVSGSESFSSRGNNYFNKLNEKNRI